MALSDQAVGFFLQMEDQMTPKFPGVVAAYDKFTRSIEKASKRAYKTSSGFLGSLGQLAAGVGRAASSATAKVDVMLTAKSKRSLARTVSEAVGDALAGVSMRLRPTTPGRLMKMFSQEASLRALYRQMPQPPDMVGGFQRFAKGGRVQGGTKGKDSVLGLLTPGEVVLPVDLVAKLEDAFEQVSSRKDVIAEGLGDKADLAFYTKAMTEISEAMEVLATAARNSGFEVKARLAPQITTLRSRFDALTASVDKTSDESNHLLSRILGPARFVALSTALRDTRDGFGQLTGGLQQAAGDLGAGEFQSFAERLREIRQRLGLSAEAAAKFTGAIGAQSDVLGVNYFKSLEAVDVLISKGIKDQKVLLEQGPLLARANRITGADFDSLANSIFRFTSEMGGSTEQFDALMLSINNMQHSAKLAVNAPELMQALGEALNTPAMKGAGAEAVQTFANNLLTLRAAAESTFEGESGIEGIFRNALQGTGDESVAALTTLQRLTFGQINNFDQLKTALSKRGGLIGVFDQLGETVKGIQDPAALGRLADDMGVNVTFLQRIAEFSKAQRDASGLAVAFDQSTSAGGKLSQELDKITTSTEKIANTISSFVGKSGAMQSLIEFLDQIPVLAILASVHLGKTLLTSVFAFGAGVVKTLGSIAVAGGGILGKAAVAGGGVLGKVAGVVGTGIGAVAAVGGAAIIGTAVAADQLQEAIAEAGESSLTEFGKVGDRILNSEKQIRQLQATLALVPENELAQQQLTRMQGKLAGLRSEARQMAGASDPLAPLAQTMDAPDPLATLTQSTSLPTISKEEIDQIMQVTVQSRNESDLQETNSLLRQLVDLMSKSNANTQQAAPSRVMQPTTRQSDNMLSGLASFTQ